MKIFRLVFLFALLASGAASQNPVLVVPRGHAENVSQILATPGDKYLVSGAWDQTVRIWEMSTGRELRSLEGFESWIKALKVSPEGRFLAVGGGKDLRIYDLEKGAKLLFHDTAITASVEAIAYHPGGKILATADKSYQTDGRTHEVKLWTANGLKLQKRVAVPDEVISLLFLPDGDLLCIMAGGTLQIAVATGAISRRQDFSAFDISYVSQDGKILVNNDFENAFGGGMPSAVLKLKDRTTGKDIVTLKGHRYSVKSVAFNHNGTYMASGADDGTINIWDLVTQKLAYTLKGYGADTYTLTFNATGDKLVSGNTDNIIRVWDFKKGIVLSQMGGFANVINSLEIDSAGKTLAIAGSNKKGDYLNLLDLKASTIRTLDSSSYISQALFSHDGGYLVVSEPRGGVTIYNTENGSRIKRLGSPNHRGTAFALSANGDRLAVGNSEGDSLIRLYNFPDLEEVLTLKPGGIASSLAFSADGKTLFAGGQSDETESFEAATGKRLTTFAHKSARASYMSIVRLQPLPDGLLTADYYGTLRWWNKAGIETDSVDTVMTGINEMRLLPGGKQLVMAGGSSAFPDPPIRILDMAAHKVVRTLIGHSNSASALAVTPDGAFLFSGSFDRTVKLWNLRTGEVIATLVFLGGGDWVIVDKDGRFDGTREGMRQMYYTQGLSVLPLESGFEQFYTPGLLPRLLKGEVFAPTTININALKAPPAITMTTTGDTRGGAVTNGAEVRTAARETITVNLKASSPGDAVTEIRLYQNGKLVQSLPNPQLGDAKAKQSLTGAFLVTLSAGENRLRAVAFNSQRTESLPAEAIISYGGSGPAAARATLHLVVVGINKYKNPRYNLNYAGADAISFREVMEKNSANIFAGVKTTYLADAGATKEAISEALRLVAKGASSTDVFVFYYAGHGVMSSGATKDFFIVPHDVTQLYGADEALAQKGLSTRELQELSKNIPAQKQLFMLDACQSAGALDIVAANRGAAEEKAIAQFARSTGTHWLTASGSDQFATEFAQLGHGIFTYVLLQALTAGTGSDNRVSVNSLKAFLEAQVPELSEKYKGTPQYPASYGYGNDFPIMVIRR